VKDSDVLRAASEIVRNGFTKEAYARVGGHIASPSNPCADCFCLLGAVVRAAGTDSIAAGDAIVTKWVVPLIPKRAIHETFYPGSARGWNDEPARTQQQVVDMLNMAADVAKSKGE
jgi:hypothetical protein